MKRIIATTQRDTSDDYLEAKHHIDQSIKWVSYLELTSEDLDDKKMFRTYGSQLVKMSQYLQDLLNQQLPLSEEF